MNTLKPNLYECKICGEHHCDHDFPDDGFGQDMTLVDSTSGVPLILQTPPLANQTIMEQRGTESAHLRQAGEESNAERR